MGTKKAKKENASWALTIPTSLHFGKIKNYFRKSGSRLHCTFNSGDSRGGAYVTDTASGRSTAPDSTLQAGNSHHTTARPHVLHDEDSWQQILIAETKLTH